MRQLSSLIELAEVHITEAQVVVEIEIVGVLAVEPFQIDAASSRRPVASSWWAIMSFLSNSFIDWASRMGLA